MPEPSVGRSEHSAELHRPLFRERSPEAIAQGLAEHAEWVLSTTTVPAGYGPAPDRGVDDDAIDRMED